jgi:hypothetical protein
MSSVLVIGTNKRKKEIRISEWLSDSNIQSAVKIRVPIRVWIQKFWTQRDLDNTPNLWINIWNFELEPIYTIVNHKILVWITIRITKFYFDHGHDHDHEYKIDSRSRVIVKIAFTQNTRLHGLFCREALVLTRWWLESHWITLRDF